MSYCIYLRKSRADIEAEARGDGETLARHQTTLLDIARKQNLAVGAVYKELVSGETISARPEMQKLIQEVSASVWEGVLCMEIERLARGDTIDQGLVAQAFKYSNTKIITPLKTYDPNNEFDEEYFEFNLFMSRREYKTIKRRMQAGRLASIKEGNYIGSLPPFGYKKVHDYANKCFTLEIIPREAEAVRLIFDLYLNKGMGYSRIASYITQLGYSPKKGGIFTANSIRDILANPLYCGILRWNSRKIRKTISDGKIIVSRPRSEGILFPGRHPSIISREMFDSARQLSASKSHVPLPSHSKIKNHYAGLLYCAECGHAMTRRPCKSNDSIAQIMCPHKGCKTKSSYISVVDEAVILFLQTYLHDLQIKTDAENPQNKHSKDVIKNAAAELLKLKRQKERLYTLLEQDVYTKDVFVERMSAVQKKMQAVSEIINEYSDAVECTKDEKVVMLKNVIANFDKIDNARDRNILLKTIINRIDYNKTQGGRYNPSDLKLCLTLKL